jgi:type IV secretory pathway TrbL component
VTTSILDDITIAFVGALQTGVGVLAFFSLPLLTVLGIIAFYWRLAPQFAAGSAGMGDAMASTLLYAVVAGSTYWVLTNIVVIAQAAFDTFFGWGISVSGYSGGDLSQPSIVMNLATLAIAPQKSFIDRLIGWGKVFDFDHVVNFDVAGWIVWVAMLLLALHQMLILIEWHMSILVSTVLIPWGLFGPTAFLAEVAVGWVGGNLVRLLVTGAYMGIAVPLYQTVSTGNLNAANGDPSVYGHFLLVAVSVVFAILAWVIPGRAAWMVGRGLGLTGAPIVGAAVGTARFSLLAGGSVVRGASRMLRS